MRTSGENSKSLVVLLILLILFLAPEESGAKPLIREKRVSDQRLAELETLLALSKMKEKLVTVPIGFGRIDPHKIGRKRREIEDDLFVEQEEVLHTTAAISIHR